MIKLERSMQWSAVMAALRERISAIVFAGRRR